MTRAELVCCLLHLPNLCYNTRPGEHLAGKPGPFTSVPGRAQKNCASRDPLGDFFYFYTAASCSPMSCVGLRGLLAQGIR